MLVVARRTTRAPEHRARRCETRDGERITRVRIGRSDTAWSPSTEKGNLYHWELAPEVRLTEVAHVSEQEPVTALEYALGGITLIVGDAQGQRLRPGSACG